MVIVFLFTHTCFREYYRRGKKSDVTQKRNSGERLDDRGGPLLVRGRHGSKLTEFRKKGEKKNENKWTM